MKTAVTTIALCLMTHALCAQDLKYFIDASGKYGYKDASGKTVISPSYQKAFDFKEGLGCIQLDDKWGFVDQMGKKVILLKYDDAQWFSEGLAMVNKGATKDGYSWAWGGKYGFIDKSGKEVIPLKYDKASGFSEGLASVNIGATRGKYGMEGGKYGYIDRLGNEVIPIIYDKAGTFSEGLATVGLDGKEGFIDNTGKVIIPLKYDRTSNFKGGLACVKLDGKYGFINKSEVAVIPLIYDNADYTFSYGLAYVALNKKYGFIDKAGKEIIPIQYDDAHSFKQGLASVKMAGKWGFIDTTGKVIIAMKYEYAGSFIDDNADVKLDGREFSISIFDKSIYGNETFESKETSFAGRNEIVPALSEEEEESLTGDLIKLYFKNDKLLFAKVTALNEYLKTTMVLYENGDFDKTMWQLNSSQIKNTYCEQAKQPLTVYKNDLKMFKAGAQKLDLYLGIKGYLDAVNKFIYDCESWADFIYYPGREFKETEEMLQTLENSLKAMKMGDVFLRGLVTEYQNSKKTTGKFLTTMKAENKRNNK